MEKKDFIAALSTQAPTQGEVAFVAAARGWVVADPLGGNAGLS